MRFAEFVVNTPVFDREQFGVEFHNESEDQVYAIRAALPGHRFGYFDDVSPRRLSRSRYQFAGIVSGQTLSRTDASAQL